jgi:hypothetical protein
MPGSPSPVPRTVAGLPPCSSTQRRISSWSVVVLVVLVAMGFAIDRSRPLARAARTRRVLSQIA